MFYEYQVTYRCACARPMGDNSPAILGPVLALCVKAQNPQEAARFFKGCEVLNIGEGEALIDWEHQKNFTRTEAAAYLRSADTTIDKLAAKGLLPHARDHKPIWTRSELDELIRKRMVKTPNQPTMQEAA